MAGMSATTYPMSNILYNSKLATGGYVTSSWSNSTNITFTSNSVQFWQRPPKCLRGKYAVRCSGCGRFSKIVSAFGWGYTVTCERCLGEKTGMVKW